MPTITPYMLEVFQRMAHSALLSPEESLAHLLNGLAAGVETSTDDRRLATQLIGLLDPVTYAAQLRIKPGYPPTLFAGRKDGHPITYFIKHLQQRSHLLTPESKVTELLIAYFSIHESWRKKFDFFLLHKLPPVDFWTCRLQKTAATFKTLPDMHDVDAVLQKRLLSTAIPYLSTRTIRHITESLKLRIIEETSYLNDYMMVHALEKTISLVSKIQDSFQAEQQDIMLKHLVGFLLITDNHHRIGVLRLRKWLKPQHIEQIQDNLRLLFNPNRMESLDRRCQLFIEFIDIISPRLRAAIIKKLLEYLGDTQFTLHVRAHVASTLCRINEYVPEDSRGFIATHFNNLLAESATSALYTMLTTEFGMYPGWIKQLGLRINLDQRIREKFGSLRDEPQTSEDIGAALPNELQMQYPCTALESMELAIQLFLPTLAERNKNEILERTAIEILAIYRHELTRTQRDTYLNALFARIVPNENADTPKKIIMAAFIALADCKDYLSTEKIALITEYIKELVVFTPIEAWIFERECAEAIIRVAQISSTLRNDLINLVFLKRSIPGIWRLLNVLKEEFSSAQIARLILGLKNGPAFPLNDWPQLRAFLPSAVRTTILNKMVQPRIDTFYLEVATNNVRASDFAGFPQDFLVKLLLQLSMKIGTYHSEHQHALIFFVELLDVYRHSLKVDALQRVAVNYKRGQLPVEVSVGICTLARSP